MDFRLTYLHATLVHSKGQGEGHAFFYCVYFQGSITLHFAVWPHTSRHEVFGRTI